MNVGIARRRTHGAAAPAVPPVSLFSPSSVPSNPSENDTTPLELGVKFHSDVAGAIVAVRFYKSALNTGTHPVRLWAIDGTELAVATVSGESASGWQEGTFATPIVITAGVDYVASYHTATGHYAADSGGLSGGVDNAPLHAPASASVGGNGVYAEGAAGSFPTNFFQATNYWVDVVFQPA